MESCECVGCISFGSLSSGSFVRIGFFFFLHIFILAHIQKSIYRNLALGSGVQIWAEMSDKINSNRMNVMSKAGQGYLCFLVTLP